MSNVTARETLRLVPAESEVAAEPSSQRERRLLAVAEELSEAVEHLRRAAIQGAPLLPGVDLRGLLDEVTESQVRVADELGRAVGERVAAAYRWSVRSGVEVLEDR